MSVESGADPGLGSQPAVTFPAAEHHRPLARYQIILFSDRGTWVLTLAQSRYLVARWLGIELATSQSLVRRHNHCTTEPHNIYAKKISDHQGVDVWTE